MRLSVLALAVLFCACGTNRTGPTQSNNASQGKTSSTTNQNGNANSRAGKGSNQPSGNAGQNGVIVPDPHASTDPKVGREAGIGDDPANLEVSDPKGNSGSSGGRQAHAKR